MTHFRFLSAPFYLVGSACCGEGGEACLQWRKSAHGRVNGGEAVSRRGGCGEVSLRPAVSGSGDWVLGVEEGCVWGRG